ncbi:MAG: fructose bisphosphate aldolase [Cutibacterium avidum]|nr:fructose bisphosphate aldolase [Cutibacterium avidum]
MEDAIEVEGDVAMTANDACAQQTERMGTAPGFIAALDQSGGSTPKALKAYGVEPEVYGDDKDKMFDLVHEMRTRIITSPSFTSDHILAAILFEMTMDREIEGIPTADFLWQRKGIIPFLKIDKGLADEESHVRVMKPIPGLDELLHRAVEEKHIFGTKERSVILDDDKDGIKKIVDQQFELGEQVRAAGLVPILEPEVDIHAPNKQKAEERLHNLIREHIDALPLDAKIMLKLTIPTTDDLYADVIADPKVLRVVALSGGYSREEANEKLARNHGLIASFSRALAEGLSHGQSQEEFDETLRSSIDSIYAASVS